jgi:uncharacterized protein (TIGR00369 family)
MSEKFQPRDPGYEARVRDSFARQGAMQSMAISMDTVAPGRVELSLPHQQAYTQQHGFMHAGVISTAMDSACGYAAFTLMSADAAVLSVEFKANFLAPAAGERFEIVADVVKPGRTISVVNGEAFAVSGEERKLIATMTATIMAVYDRPGIDQ